MIIEIGHFSVVVALVLSVLGIGSSIAALRTRNPDWVRVGRISVTLIFALLFIGMASLVYAFIVRDFSVAYVANNSNSKLPFFYTISAVWGGHEGSLLLWVFILSVFSTLAVWLHWRTQPTIMPYLISMSGLIYLVAALGLGGYFLYYAVRMYRDHEDEELPMQMFRYSISYLGYLFAALLVDHYFLIQLAL